MLAKHLRVQGHDAVHATDVGLYRASDADILAMATRDQRIVVTADLDFPRLAMAAEYAAASVILFRGGDFDDAMAHDFMKRALGQLDANSRRRFVMTVDRSRIRRRWLD
jgi:predicted nuclease of predicted toxin-antitoxin system